MRWRWQTHHFRLGTKIPGRRLGPAADVKFLKDMHQMRAHGIGADVEARSQVFVGQSLGHQREQFRFTRGQLLRAVGIGRFRSLP